MAEWNESAHKRAANGQFGSHGTVHIVTTGGNTPEVRDVTDDADDASDLRDAIEEDEGDDTAEHHEVDFERSTDDSVTAVHVVHGSDGIGGTSVYGAYDDGDIARGHAVAHSRSAWDAYGPDRGEIDRDEAEEDEAAERWNEDHADDDGAILAKVDDRGMIERDANGALQWVQDGDDVDPGDDHEAEFGDHFEAMFPADDRAAYPGFDAANDHFETSGQMENVFRVHRHEV